MRGHFLGIDCSTQSMKAVVVDWPSLTIQTKLKIKYDEDLPHYRTQNGVYFSKNGAQACSNPLMWVEALDLLLETLQEKKILLDSIKAIGGSAQQHGTVYLRKSFSSVLSNLNSNQSLAHQLEGSLSRDLSPVWMDSSTSKQCHEIRESLGGTEETIGLTGSNAIERFSGPQIRKFYQETPQKYENTASIHLISSFLCSLLLGAPAPIDHGDGSGMNLMNIAKRTWDERALDATAPNLRQKLPALVESFSIIGNIAPYHVKRYGFSPETKLVPWSGDNPNSIAGVGLVHSNQVAVSLGTSDTFFGRMGSLILDMRGESHVFGAPFGDYMALICFKNGALAREAIKKRFNLTWEEFSEILNNTPPGNNGGIMLPYFYSEIVPLVLKPQVHRFGFDEGEKDANVRGIVEAQCLSMRLHSRWLRKSPEEIIATGGGSENREMLRVLANVFQCPVKALSVSDSAALGAALRSVKSYRDFFGSGLEWVDLVAESDIFHPREIFVPSEQTKSLYGEMLDLYQAHEDFIVRKGKNPTKKRLAFKEKYF